MHPHRGCVWSRVVDFIFGAAKLTSQDTVENDPVMNYWSRVVDLIFGAVSITSQNTLGNVPVIDYWIVPQETRQQSAMVGYITPRYSGERSNVTF